MLSMVTGVLSWRSKGCFMGGGRAVAGMGCSEHLHVGALRAVAQADRAAHTGVWGYLASASLAARRSLSPSCHVAAAAAASSHTLMAACLLDKYKVKEPCWGGLLMRHPCACLPACLARTPASLSVLLGVKVCRRPAMRKLRARLPALAIGSTGWVHLPLLEARLSQGGS